MNKKQTIAFDLFCEGRDLTGGRAKVSPKEQISEVRVFRIKDRNDQEAVAYFDPAAFNFRPYLPPGTAGMKTQARNKWAAKELDSILKSIFDGLTDEAMDLFMDQAKKNVDHAMKVLTGHA